jgi:hypothetical protein
MKNHAFSGRMALSWETLWKADKPKEGPAAPRSAQVGRFGKNTPDSCTKGKRGMTVKPISWVPSRLKTSKGVKALEDDQMH